MLLTIIAIVAPVIKKLWAQLEQIAVFPWSAMEHTHSEAAKLLKIHRRTFCTMLAFRTLKGFPQNKHPNSCAPNGKRRQFTDRGQSSGGMEQIHHEAICVV